MSQNLNDDLASLVDPVDVILALAYAHHIREISVVSDVAYDKYKTTILRSDKGPLLRRRFQWIIDRGYPPPQIRDLAFYLITLHRKRNP